MILHRWDVPSFIKTVSIVEYLGGLTRFQVFISISSVYNSISFCCSKWPSSCFCLLLWALWFFTGNTVSLSCSIHQVIIPRLLKILCVTFCKKPNLKNRAQNHSLQYHWQMVRLPNYPKKNISCLKGRKAQVSRENILLFAHLAST